MYMCSIVLCAEAYTRARALLLGLHAQSRNRNDLLNESAFGTPGALGACCAVAPCAVRIPCTPPSCISQLQMAVVPNLIKEIHHMAEWAKSQLDAQIDADLVRSSQHDILMSKIRELKPMEYHAATALINAVTDVSNAALHFNKDDMLTTRSDLRNSMRDKGRNKAKYSSSKLSVIQIRREFLIIVDLTHFIY